MEERGGWFDGVEVEFWDGESGKEGVDGMLEKDRIDILMNNGGRIKREEGGDY